MQPAMAHAQAPDGGDRLAVSLAVRAGSRFGGSAPLFVVAAAVSIQAGAAVATRLFPLAGALGTLWLRTAFAAACLALVGRGRIRRPARADLGTLAAFAVVLTAMNACYFEAIDRAPLGVVSTIEFLGPLAVAVWGSRGRLELLWVALAAVGVGLLGSPASAIGAAGLAFALASAVFWAAYIVLGKRVVGSIDPLSALALALGASAVLLTPAGLVSGGTGLLDPTVIGGGIAVALLASALPYLLELLALRAVRAATYSILLSLEPAIAALIGLIALGQHLRSAELAAIGCVIAASAGASVRAKTPPLT
jgi:inner membrane transporter RhtA